jgi:uncharacterized protein YdhG (YjbR/CyaY superfamily)
MSADHPEVDVYINGFSGELQLRLQQLRQLIRELAPEAVESMAYGMPAYKLFGRPLVYFAGYAHHLGLYALPSAHSHFTEALAAYKQGKGSVQFPLKEPMPWALIADIIRFRIEENTLKKK